MMLHSLDLVSLFGKYNLGISERGLLTAEAVPLKPKADEEGSLLNRAQFHIIENMYEMGSNGILVLESEEGFAESVTTEMRSKVDIDYVYFMNQYLIYFFMKQFLRFWMI